MGTERGPTLRRKLNHYVLIAQAVVVGQDQFLPRVLIYVPDKKRLDQIQEIIRALPAPADKLFHVSMDPKGECRHADQQRRLAD